MKQIMTRTRFGLVVAAAAVLGLGVIAFAAAGGGTGAPPVGGATVSEERARDIATNALDAFNAGDYEGWSRDWSPTLKAAIGEQAFLAFRDQATAGLGTYVSIEALERTSTKPGTHRWTATVTFEKGSAKLGFGFIDGSGLVEGVFFE